jgi:hypothetical protein
VLSSALTSAVLAYATGDTARRRGDARLFVVALAFLAAAGFLGLHALATPGVLLEKRTAGFGSPPPSGLLVPPGSRRSRATHTVETKAQADRRERDRVPRRAHRAHARLGGAVARPPSVARRRHAAGERVSAADGPRRRPGLALNGTAAYRYGALYTRLALRPIPWLPSVTAFVLLAEAMIAVAFAATGTRAGGEWHCS